MAICVPFSHLFCTYFFHQFRFSYKKITPKPTWDVILLIDSYIHAHELLCKNIINIGCLFHPKKSDNWDNSIQSVNTVIFMIMTHWLV